jgi:hypothetical protein
MFFYSDNVANGYNPLQQIKFNDGTTWSAADVSTKTMAGTATQLSSAVRADAGDIDSSSGAGAMSSRQSWLHHGATDSLVGHAEYRGAPARTASPFDGQVDALISAMASFAPPAAAESTLHSAAQTTVNPIIVVDYRSVVS